MKTSRRSRWRIDISTLSVLALLVVLVVLTVVFSWFASASKPFTTPADLYTATPLVLATVVILLQLFNPSTRGLTVLRRVVARNSKVPDHAELKGGTPWILLAALVVAWELACYLLGPRAQHPTISSLYNIAARIRWVKASIIALWISLGAYLLKQ
ncbi:MAG: hypothetical protein ACYDEP_04495 [Acidimicrobiales bacterium]